MSHENFGGVPEEARNFKMEAEQPEKKHGRLDRATRTLKKYARAALVAGAMLIPGTVQAERLAQDEGQGVEDTMQESMTEAEQQQLKSWQRLVNDAMERATEEFSDVDNAVVDKFQQEGWDLAAFGVKEQWTEAEFTQALESLYAGTFKPEVTTVENASENLTETQAHALKEMQQSVNEFIEGIEARPDNRIAPELMNQFQQMCWDLAGRMAKEGQTLEDFTQVVDMMYEKSVGKYNKPETEAVALEGLEVLPDTVEITPKWMWENVGKIFQRNGKIISVASAKSGDMQGSFDEASLVAAARATEIYNEITVAKDTTYTRSAATLGNSIDLGRDLKMENNIYEGVIVLRFDVVERSK